MILKSISIVTLLITNFNALADETPARPTDLVTFYVMGDVPYEPAEDILLPKQITELPNDAEFVVHVGDIKGGATACSEDVYSKVSGMLSRSQAPVFIIPGDNEWNDCVNPAEAWTFWEKHFMRFDNNWNHSIPLFRQLEREENFSFVQHGVLFVGINIVGGRIHDADEWKQRLADDVDWVHRNMKKHSHATSMVLFGHALPKKEHDDFFLQFNEAAKEFEKPILYLHGDGHRWMHDRPFAAQNILRVQVDQGGTAPPLRVTVTNQSTEPFQFQRRRNSASARQKVESAK